MKLRDYQEKTVDKALQYQLISNEIVIMSPVGSGKTLVISEIAKRVSNLNNVLIITAFSQLISQIDKTLQLFGIEPNIIKSGEHRETDSSIYLATEQSFNETRRANFEHLKRCVIIKDEIQNSRLKRWNDIINFLNPIQIFGFTATPCNAKGELISKHIIEAIKPKELLEKGFWSKIKYYIPSITKEYDLEKLKSSGSDYTESSNASIIDDHIGSIIKTINEQIPKEEKTLIFAPSIESAEKINDLMINNGYSSAVVHSKKDPKENKINILKFKDEFIEDKNLFEEKRDSINVLVSVTSLSTGFDAPNAKNLVNLRITKSIVLWNQLFGRITRPYDYEFKRIFDFGSVVERFGLLEDFDLDYIKNKKFEKQSKINKVINYANEDIEIEKIDDTIYIDGDEIDIKLTEFKQESKKNPYINMMIVDEYEPTIELFKAIYLYAESNGMHYTIRQKDWIYEMSYYGGSIGDTKFLPVFKTLEEINDVTSIEYKRRLFKAIKTRVVNIVNIFKETNRAKGKITSLPFFITYIVENDEYLKTYIENRGAILYKEEDLDKEDDLDDDIPF